MKAHEFTTDNGIDVEAVVTGGDKGDIRMEMIFSKSFDEGGSYRG